MKALCFVAFILSFLLSQQQLTTIGNTATYTFTSCPVGFIAGTTNTFQCYVCTSSAGSCFVCPAGKKLYGATCESSAPTGYTLTSDQESSPGYFYESTSCIYGQTYLSSSCQACTSPCETCEGGLTSPHCTSCISGQLLQGGTCVVACTGVYTASTLTNALWCECSTTAYSSFTNGIQTCTACDPRCTGGCTGSGNTQIICSGSCDITLTVASVGTCVTTCPSEGSYYLKSSNSTCEACHAECNVGCSGPNQNECVNSGGGNVCKNVMAGSKCEATCGAEAGYYLDGAISTYTCQQCHAQCSACTASGVATSGCTCKNYTEGTNCVQSCGAQYFPVSLTTPSSCTQCDPLCNGCGGSGTTIGASGCTACANYQEGATNQCVTTCTGLFYNPATSTGTCLDCDGQCATGCTGGANTQCTGSGAAACNTYLEGSACVTSCTGQYYLASGNAVCQNCDARCVGCTAGGNTTSQCSACATLTEGTLCVNACEGSYFQASLTLCTACNSACRTCTGALSTECLTCSTGYAATAAAPNTCTACNASCATCFGSPTNCRVCAAGYYKVYQHLQHMFTIATTASASPISAATAGAYCQPCHTSCSATSTTMKCRGPLATDCFI